MYQVYTHLSGHVFLDRLHFEHAGPFLVLVAASEAGVRRTLHLGTGRDIAQRGLGSSEIRGASSMKASLAG